MFLKSNEAKLMLFSHFSQSMQQEMEEIADLFQEVKQINKLTKGYVEFGLYSDVAVMNGNHGWTAHAYVLDSRSEEILKEQSSTRTVNGRNFRRIYLSELYGDAEANSFLRWLYTDYVGFEDNYVVKSLLKASHRYKLPELFERCEQEIVKKVDIFSCAYFHEFALKLDATRILRRCEQLISYYYNVDVPSADDSKLDVKMETDVDCDSSLCDMMVGTFYTLVSIFPIIKQ